MALVKYGFYVKEYELDVHFPDIPLLGIEKDSCIKHRGHNISSDVLYPDISGCVIPWLSHPGLPRMVNSTEYQNMKKLMVDIHNIFTENNITYVMAYGTLLGSYVTHDALPWDDDIDLLVKYTDKNKIVDLLEDHKKYPDHKIVVVKGDPERMKIYNVNSPQAGELSWGWPFADIMYMEEDNRSVWASEASQFKVARSEFYPLRRRPLFGLWFPAPRNPRLLLQSKYKKFTCHSHTWDHRNEKRTKESYIDCIEMEKYYPVVHRVPYKGGASESLQMNGSEIYTIFVDEPATGKSHGPFDLL